MGRGHRDRRLHVPAHAAREPASAARRTCGYQDGFIEHYVIALVYPARLTREAQLVLGTAVLALNLVVYWRVLTVSRREQRRAARGANV